MEDHKIIALYWERSERAISETANKYSRYCHYIADRILNNDADAQEIVNDTYLKAWNSIPPQKPTSLKSYVGMIARQLAFDTYRAQKAEKRGGQMPLVLDELAECIPSGEDIGESVALRDILNAFLGTLPKKTQKVFVRRYWYASPTSEIATEYGMTENHVNVLLCHTRKKLKAFLSKEGFEV